MCNCCNDILYMKRSTLVVYIVASSSLLFFNFLFTLLSLFWKQTISFSNHYTNIFYNYIFFKSSHTFSTLPRFYIIITLPIYININTIFLIFYTLIYQEIKIEEKKDEDVNREAVAVRMQLKHRTKIVNILSDTLTKLNDVYSVAKKFDR